MEKGKILYFRKNINLVINKNFKGDIMEFIVRKIKSEEYNDVMKLVLEVYMEFEAPIYGEEGVNTFYRDVINNKEYKKDFEKGNNMIFGAFYENHIIGVVGTRGKSHISLVFTKKEHHRKGVASKIIKVVMNEIESNNPEVKEITLNSSPYGLSFYHSIGFIDTDVEKITDGIIYTPMKYVL